jgi:hypothetical protein
VGRGFSRANASSFLASRGRGWRWKMDEKRMDFTCLQCRQVIVSVV